MTFLGKGESSVWITSEVEIPDELIDHLEKRKVSAICWSGSFYEREIKLTEF